MAPASSSLTAIAAAQLLPDLHAGAFRVLDARHPRLHALERVRGAVLPPPLHQLAGLRVLVYDAGAASLEHHFTRAVRLARAVLAACPTGTDVVLLAGGLPAVRALAPHLIDTPSATVRTTPLLPPWAHAALRAAEDEAALPGRLLPWLYVGAVRHASDPDWLAHARVTHVLTVCDAPVAPLPGINYRFLQAPDLPDFPLVDAFRTAISFLRTVKAAHGTCLVHCTAGASRSVAVVAAYLVWTGLSAKDALERIREVRAAADPNAGFVRQLDDWELRLREGCPVDDDEENPEDEENAGEQVREEELETNLDFSLCQLSVRNVGKQVPDSPVTPLSQNLPPHRNPGDWALVEYSPSMRLALTMPAITNNYCTHEGESR